LLRYAYWELKDFDVVHIYGFREYLTLVAALWARRAGKPYVLQTLGTVPRITRSRTKKFLFDTLFGRSILRGAAALIAKTPVDRVPYLDAGIPPEKIELIPNGISTPKELEELEGGEFRREFGIEEDETLFLFVGRIHPVKGVDLLVRAFAEVDKGARLAIVGPDEGYRREIERFASKTGLAERIIFTGPLYGSRKWAAYQDADVYILPSVHENFGMTVLEAMICDTPVIVTEGCGIAPQIQDRSGLVVPHDERALAQAMQSLQKDTQLRGELASGARLLIREEFSWKPVVENLEALYEKVISTAEKKP
jgi:glycosyltransferase involved in cell wall biosynthesis